LPHSGRFFGADHGLQSVEQLVDAPLEGEEALGHLNGIGDCEEVFGGEVEVARRLLGLLEHVAVEPLKIGLRDDDDGEGERVVMVIR
jgi:hypothetical protein